MQRHTNRSHIEKKHTPAYYYRIQIQSNNSKGSERTLFIFNHCEQSIFAGTYIFFLSVLCFCYITMEQDSTEV